MPSPFFHLLLSAALGGALSQVLCCPKLVVALHAPSVFLGVDLIPKPMTEASGRSESGRSGDERRSGEQAG